MNAIIRAAFEERLATWAASRGLPVAWQNVTFDPPATTYLRAFLLPAETDSRDLAGVHREYRGVWQVTVVCPVGEGPGAGEAIAAELDALYPTTAPLVRDSLSIYLTRPMSAAPAIQEPDRYAIPVSCGYVANTDP